MTATLLPVSDSLYAVHLTGALNTQADVDKAIATVRSFYPNPIAVIVSELTVKQAPSVQTADSLKSLIEGLLNNPGVKSVDAINVVVKEVEPGRFAVRLHGTAENQKTFNEAVASLAPLQPSPILTLNTSGVKITPPATPPVETVERWRMNFLPLGVRPLDPNEPPASSGGKEDTIDKLVSAMNRIYGTEKKPAVERANYSELILRGGPETRLKIKRLLAVIDVAWPQVQTNIWAIQVSGDRAEVGRKVKRIEDQTRLTRRTVNRAMLLMNRIINRNAYRFTDVRVAGLLQRMKILGFRADPNGPLSLNESLIFMALDPARKPRFGSAYAPTLATLFAEAVRKDSSLYRDDVLLTTREWQELNVNSELRANAYQRFERVLEELRFPIVGNPDAFGIDQFVDSLETFRGEGQALADAKKNVETAENNVAGAAPGSTQRTQFEAIAEAARLNLTRLEQNAPLRLAVASATADRLLKQAVDAFSEDTDVLFFSPLLEFAQNQGSNKSGVAMIGQTRIVVTSNIEARLAGDMSSYVETTRPRPFGKELLDMAFPQTRDSSDSREASVETEASSKAGADGGTPTVTGPDTESSSKQSSSDALTNKGLTGAQLLLSTLNPAQALGLAAVLSDSVAPTFAKVAPGIAINIRPMVFPDGGSARMVIEARFGVKTTDLGDNSGRKDVFVYPQPSAVESHRIATDTAVSAFDLFDLSHFMVTTSTPQPPQIVPVFGRLPLLGPLFQRPRGNKDVYHESVLLINTVILPRSMEMARFYVGQ